jgi:hypothetical protein
MPSLHRGGLARGTFHSTGVRRFIARPGPVPLQSRHGNAFFYVARSYAGLHNPRVSRQARIAPLPLFGSMLSETPGVHQSLSLASTDAWACAQVNTLSRHPLSLVLRAMCQMQSIHSSPHRTPAAAAAVPGGWIALTREGFYYAKIVGIFSFSVVAQGLVN